MAAESERREEFELNLEEMLQTPGYLVRRLHQLSTAAFMEATEGLGLTPIQFSALLVIESFPDADAATISGIIAFDRVTVGQVLAVLERKGLIVREQARNDRRRKSLRLTPEGARLITTVSRQARQIEQRILGPLTGRERLTLIKLMRKIVSPTVHLPR